MAHDRFCGFRGSTALFWPVWALHLCCIDTHTGPTTENRAGPEKTDLLGQKLRWKGTLCIVITSSQRHKWRCKQVHSQFQQGQSSIAQASSKAADCQSALTMALFTGLLWAGSSLWMKRTPQTEYQETSLIWQLVLLNRRVAGRVW